MAQSTGDFVMKVEIHELDYSPVQLEQQLPFVVEVIRQMPGPDRPDYWLGKLFKPVEYVFAGVTHKFEYVTIATRFMGAKIEPNAPHLAVGIAFVKDSSIVEDKELSFEKVEYLAIGIDVKVC